MVYAYRKSLNNEQWYAHKLFVQLQILSLSSQIISHAPLLLLFDEAFLAVQLLLTASLYFLILNTKDRGNLQLAL